MSKTLKLKIKQIDFWDMQSAAKLRHESNAAYQISPTPILDINGYAKKTVGGRGGAFKLYLINNNIQIPNKNFSEKSAFEYGLFF